jgi:hypothetical protein
MNDFYKIYIVIIVAEEKIIHRELPMSLLPSFIPRSEFLFTVQGSIFIPLFGDYINTTML